jgi:RNA polymerase sigma factor (sigma-70 family)
MRDEASIDLIHRARSGDDAAFGRLVDRYVPRLRGWARGRLPHYARDLADTNDLVQDALVGTMRNLGRFDIRADGGLHAYLRRAVLNRIRDQVRYTARRPRRDLLDPALRDPAPSPFERAATAEARARLARGRALLRPAEQRLIALYLQFGLDYAAIAAAAGKPSAGAARGALGRALKRLKRVLRDDDPRRVARRVQ